MALSTKVGSFSLNASTGNQSITGLGFQPKIILFFMNRRTSDGTIGGASHCRGAAISASEMVANADYVPDSSALVGAANQVTYDTTSYCLASVQGLSTTLMLASLVSMDADGFTININTTDGVQRVVNFVAIGGTDLTNVKIKEFTTKTSTGTQAITGVGFQPDSMILMGNLNSSAPPYFRGVNHNFGWGTSATNRGALGWQSGQNSNPTVVKVQQDTAKILNNMNVTQFQVADLTSFDSDGFTLNWATANGTARYQWAICFKGGRFKVGSFNQPTSNGAQAVSGVGFQPAGIIFMAGGKATGNSIQNDYSLTFGAATSPTERFSLWAGDVSGSISNIIANGDLDRTKVFKNFTPGTPTLNSAADLTSLDSDGFTLNWSTTDATAREVLYFAYAGFESKPVSDSGSGTDIVGVGSTLPIEDSVTGTDSLALDKTLPVEDSGAGVESLSVNTSADLSDFVLGTETLTLVVTTSISDLISSAELLTVLQNKALMDSNIGGDRVRVKIAKTGQNKYPVRGRTLLFPK